MKLLCNVLSLCALAMAIPFDSLDSSAVDKRATPGVLTTKLSINDIFSYHLEVKVGSEGKVFHPIADSGSLITWLGNDDDWAYHSTSLVNTTQPAYVGYAGTEQASGYYVNDTIAFADGGIDNFNFGVIENPPYYKEGIVGLARQSNSKYVPVAHQLKHAGAIDHGVASLYFSVAKDTGKLIFGGYDKAKVGSPWSVHSDPDTFKVPITNVTAQGKTYYPDHGDVPIVVDTGAYSYLPDAILDPIVALYKNPQKQDTGYKVDCDIPDGSFQLGFGDLILDIKLKEFINGHAEGDACHLAARSSERLNNITLLGGGILNHVVILFDYDNGVIKVAQFNDTDDENIVQPE
ncbi:hypothetical protein DIURU_003191 [Diutina rugosa]|uniref:Peptidase A1 domain-containing protein n=1 Tax=Diutina rugosa TaxID=5481 RepID=A0A642UM58_DIURU|nr:uncharacterized protein DIURU_003191 [Diutina rugosa]KAA8901482.1 hypothetical protein DIURU_003191 [Diutina rugosa]